ncbi:histidine phosphatase family protein [Salirhabdus sp. Marseille-P4669]|uniref:histidine phosphatase family protein n=1 Tax=Salirhabdus sp. Marseille-P4669 TaxID=2042310 RepID=UPI000C7C467B|nr:histidine phosphatase family protein [Salirhabdus sp. Marseille-P4669]
MRKLVLIKHAMPVLSDEVPSNQWKLSEKGKEKAKVLADYLQNYETDTIYSSTEPKAIETASIAAEVLEKKVTVKDDLHEHLRTSKRKIYPQQEFQEIIRNFFHYEDMLIFGEETANIAKKRFVNGVKHVLDNAQPDEDVVIVTHGTVMTLFISEFNEINKFDMWSSFGLPSIVELSREDFSL